MKSYQLLFVAFAAILLSLSSEAQTINEHQTTEMDVTARLGTDLNFKLYRNLSLQWEEEARFKDMLTSFDRLYSGVTLSNRFNEFFKVGVGYAFITRWHDGKKSTNYEKYWDLRHRVYADFTGSYRYANWKFSLRERPLFSFRTNDFDPLEKVSPDIQLRSKFQVEYTIMSKPLKPYFSVEVSNTLNAPEYACGNYIKRTRLNVGLKYRLNRINSINFYYRFDIGNNRDINIDYKKDDVTIKAVDLYYERNYSHILGIVYNFDL